MTPRRVNTLLVSDLHLLSPHAATRLLRRVITTHRFQRLVIAGDGIDNHRLWLLRWLPGHLTTLLLIRSLVRDGIEVVWILGNHDRTLERFIRRFTKAIICTEYVWEVNGVRFHTIHGDQFDGFWEKPSWIGRGLDAFYFVWHFVDRWFWLIRVLKRFHPAWRTMNRNMVTGVAAVAKGHQAHYSFHGHSHLEGEELCDGVRCVNLGSFAEYPATYGTITDDGSFALHYIY